MFFSSFRFEPAPAFETYRSLFEELVRAERAEAERSDWPPRKSKRRLVPFRRERDGEQDRVRNELIRIRQQILESIRIKEAGGAVWIPVVIRIDGGCGVLRTTRLPAMWTGSEWVMAPK